jgi:DNA mismatch repair protein MutL
MQVMRRYIVCGTADGLLLIDQQRAHQRILFEQYHAQILEGKGSSQQLLFPHEVLLTPSDKVLISENLSKLEALGFSLRLSGKDMLEVHGVPADSASANSDQVLEEFIETWKHENDQALYSGHEQMAWALAATNSIKYGQMLTTPEMRSLTDMLFRCNTPLVAKGGKPTIINISAGQMQQQFK